MDQAASVLCTEGHALFLDCRSLEVEQVPLDLAAHGQAILVIDTLTRHSHAGGEYASRREDCEQAASILGVSALATFPSTGWTSGSPDSTTTG